MTAVARLEGVHSGLAVKAPCRAATTANIALSGLQTVDGVALAEGDRVLVKDQTTAAQNGIYLASTGNWQRAKDFDGSRDITTATRVFVYAGTANGSSEWMVTTTGALVIGTTALAFQRLYGAIDAATYATVAAAGAASIPAGTTAIRTLGYSAPGTGGALYVEVADTGTLETWQFRSNAGTRRWELAETEPTIEMFGGATALASNTAALDAAAAYLTAKVRRVLHFGIGVYTFTTKPADFTRGLRLRGAGRSHTSLVRAYSAASASEGFLTWREPTGSGGVCNGGEISGMQLLAGTGTTNGSMLRLTTDGPVTGHFDIRDFVVSYSGTGSYERGLFVDGTLNTISGSQGYRDVVIHGDAYFFAQTGKESARFENATNLDADLWANNKVVVFGGGTALSNTTNARLGGTILGELFVGNATLVTTHGHCNSLIHSTGSSNCEHHGSVGGGGYSNAGTDNLQTSGLFGFRRSLATSGYQDLPGGLRMQWMQVAVTTVAAAYTFPAAFSAAPYAVTGSMTTGAANDLIVGSTSTTQVTLAAAANGTANIIAIGPA